MYDAFQASRPTPRPTPRSRRRSTCSRRNPAERPGRARGGAAAAGPGRDPAARRWTRCCGGRCTAAVRAAAARAQRGRRAPWTTTGRPARQQSPGAMHRRPLRCVPEAGPPLSARLIALQFQVAYLVVLGGVGLLALYVDLDSGAFWRILVVAEVLVARSRTSSRLTIVVQARRARPTRGCSGDRTPETAVAAWRAMPALPIDFLRHRRGCGRPVNTVPISIYIALELDDTAFFPAFFSSASRPWSSCSTARCCASSRWSSSCRRCSRTPRATCPTAPSSTASRSRCAGAAVGLPVINIITGRRRRRASPRRTTASTLGVDVLVAMASRSRSRSS